MKIRSTPLRLRPHEDVVWQTGQHWSIFALGTILPLVVILLTVGAAVATAPLRPTWTPPWPTVAWVAAIVLVVLALLRIFWLYLDWINDTFVITNQRVIWLQRRLFFSESAREIPLDRVQNVAVEVPGVVASWFNLGTLLVEASNSAPVVVRWLPRPDLVRERLVDVKGHYQAHRGRQQEEEMQTAVRNVLGLATGPAPVVVGPTSLELPNANQPFETAPEIVWHRHWWFLLRALLGPIALLGLSGVAFYLASGLTNLPWEGQVAIVAGLGVLALIGLGAAIWAILSWREDKYVLDGLKVLDIDRKPFRLHYEMKQTTIPRVQDVSYVIPHPLAHLLDYGDVYIDTAGETQRFTFDGVANPREVHAIISERVQAHRDSETVGRQRQIRQEALNMLRAYHEMTEQERARAGTPPEGEPGSAPPAPRGPSEAPPTPPAPVGP
jgi:membrane protein YdbS with pleckstrin-like domain